MIECPDLLSDPLLPKFFFIFTVVFAICTVTNPYVIYCIIYRSTRQMKRYKWYLLWHQIVSLINDVLFNYFVQPIIFLPFAMGYPRGLLAGVISTHQMTIVCVFFLNLSLATTSHLFCYRYTVVHGFNHFPPKYRAYLTFLYISVFAPAIGVGLTHEDDAAVLADLHKDFSCIDTHLLNISDFMVYRPRTFALRALPPVLFVLLIVFASTNFFIMSSLRCLNWSTASERTITMQKRFLHQLVLQAFVPLTVMFFPIVAFLYIITVQSFGMAFVAVLMIASVSFFSTSGGIVLICMNPSYHSPFTRRLPKILPKMLSSVGPSIGPPTGTAIQPQRHSFQ